MLKRENLMDKMAMA